MTDKATIKSAKITWSEGLIETSQDIEENQPTFTTWADVNAKLRELALDAPKGGGYYKTGYRIEFTDGQTYEGRIDLHHIDDPQETWSGRLDLAEKVENGLRFMADRDLPEALADRRQSFSRYIKAEEAESASLMLDSVSFEDPASNGQADFMAWIDA